MGRLPQLPGLQVVRDKFVGLFLGSFETEKCEISGDGADMEGSSRRLTRTVLPQLLKQEVK